MFFIRILLLEYFFILVNCEESKSVEFLKLNDEPEFKLIEVNNQKAIDRVVSKLRNYQSNDDDEDKEEYDDELNEQSTIETVRRPSRFYPNNARRRSSTTITTTEVTRTTTTTTISNQIIKKESENVQIYDKPQVQTSERNEKGFFETIKNVFRIN